ncbi:MAG TPA: hypothetical protein VHR39_06180 [Propionibacteriaceae bacterium]|nr:hypothetical protein [Propionibacteriaceae bacterium]
MKVLIVDAGIAGPSLAYWLLRAGHQPTLVERAPELRRGGYLIDFWGAGFDVAERMGIISELECRGYRLREARTVTKGGRRLASFPSSVLVDATGERYLSIVRSDLAAVIYGAMQDRADLILDDTVEAIEDDGDRVRVTFEVVRGAISISWWERTACTLGCGGWLSGRSRTSRSTSASWSRRST